MGDTLPLVTDSTQVKITHGNVTPRNVQSMAATEFRERWRETRAGPDRLIWARKYWQERAAAVSPTAADAAKSLGMKEGTYRAYERSEGASKTIPMDHQAAMRFGRKFGVSWRWLLLGEGTPFDEQPSPKPIERALRALESANPEQQELFAEMIERFVGIKQVG